MFKWSTIVATMQDAFINPTPVGAVWDFAGTSAPTGWVFCYGQALSRATYATLFAAIGTAYGAGDGSTTFNVPDCRGRVVAGKDDMGGSSANRLTAQTGGVNGDALGATGGAETHALLIAQITAHTHGAGSFAAANHGHPLRTSLLEDTNADATGGVMLNLTAAETKAAYTGTASDVAGRQIGGSGALNVSGTSGSAGSSSAHNNVQPTIILNKIIYTGVA